MLFIPIPNGETKGDCKINGDPCEFTIEDDVFSFRPRGSEGRWDRRAILHTMVGDKLTQYCCASEGAGPSSPPDRIYVRPSTPADRKPVRPRLGVPPSQRANRGNGTAQPERNPDATHEELQRAVIECDPMLRACWEGHGEDDMIILGDLDRPEIAEGVDQQSVNEARVVAQATDRRPWVAYKQRCGPFIDSMLTDGDPAHKLAAKELRGFRSMRPLGAVPLLVVTPGGLWATLWSDRPDFIPLRCDPATGAHVSPAN